MVVSVQQNSVSPLRVFYDGNCVVCSREAHFYLARSNELVLVDISHPGFDAVAYGKTLDQFMAELHVLDNCGEWHVGVMAFQAIWAVVPGHVYGQLAGLVEWPVVRPMAELGYKVFARYRRFLPRYRRFCDGESCRHRSL